jgi:hypothetical protein
VALSRKANDCIIKADIESLNQNKNMNKKTIGGLILSAAILMLMPFLALAQTTATSNQNIQLPQVSIASVNLDKTDIDAGATLTGKFILKNTTGFDITDLRYRMRLYEKPAGDTGKGYIDNTPTVPINTQNDPQVISVSSTEQKTISFNYKMPVNLEKGEHLFEIELFENSGNMLDWQGTKINIINASGKYISISQTELLVNSQAAESPNVGVSTKKGDKLEATLQFDNKTDLRAVKIASEVYYRDTLGEKLTDEVKDFPIVSGDNKITFELSKMEKPGGSYLARVQILDPKDNQPISNEVFFRWVIEGVSAKIVSVQVTPSTLGTDRKILSISVNYAGPADGSDGGAGQLKVELLNGLDTAASASKNVSLKDVSNTNVDLDLKDINFQALSDNLKIRTNIAKDSQVLDSYDLALSKSTILSASGLWLSGEQNNVTPTAAKNSNILKLAGIIIVIILLVIAILVILKIRKSGKGSAVLMTLLGLAILASSVIGLRHALAYYTQTHTNPTSSNVVYKNPNYLSNEKYIYYDAAYEGYSVHAQISGPNTNPYAGVKSAFFVTDTPITFNNPNTNTALSNELSSYNYASAGLSYYYDPSKLIDVYYIIPSAGKKGPFTGNDRYLYCVWMNHDGWPYEPVQFIAYKKLNSASYDQNINQFYFEDNYNRRTKVTKWTSPQINSLYSSGNTTPITFEGQLTNFGCNNQSISYIKKLEFYVSQNDLQYSTQAFSGSGSGVVTPSSIKGDNYIMLGSWEPSNHLTDFTIYGPLVFPNFPAAGTVGTTKGTWSSANMRAYLMAYGPLSSNYNNIINISSVPILYNLPTQTLTAAKTGSGAITSIPPGIDCGATCQAAFTKDSTVTLTATPDTDYTFSSWTGCASVVGNTCTVTMDADKTVAATFAVIPNLNLVVCPASTTLIKNNSSQLTAWYNASGAVSCADKTGATDVTALASWTSDNSANVSVDDASNKGKITANELGSANISAAHNSLSSSSAITVVASCSCPGSDCASVCTISKCSDTCGVSNQCSGLKDCTNSSWVEVAP